jgi:hypothetical protein
MPQICDMGQAFNLPLRSEGVLRIFFALKNPTASAGFETANLGTKVQHGTSRPPKPLTLSLDAAAYLKRLCLQPLYYSLYL